MSNPSKCDMVTICSTNSRRPHDGEDAQVVFNPVQAHRFCPNQKTLNDKQSEEKIAVKTWMRHIAAGLYQQTMPFPKNSFSTAATPPSPVLSRETASESIFQGYTFEGHRMTSIFQVF